MWLADSLLRRLFCLIPKIKSLCIDDTLDRLNFVLDRRFGSNTELPHNMLALSSRVEGGEINLLRAQMRNLLRKSVHE